MQIFATRFQITLGDLALSIGFSLDHANDGSRPEVRS